MRAFDVLTTLRSRALRVAAFASVASLSVAQSSERISVSSAGVGADLTSNLAAVSFDGRYVAFDSRATNLVANDSNGMIDVFLRDRETGQTSLVSYAAGSPATPASGSSSRPRMSEDGRYVAFYSSAPNLVAPAVFGTFRIWRRDRQTGAAQCVSVRGDGSLVTATSEFDLSPDGRFVAFISGDLNVVPGDTNGQQDVFVHDTQSGSVTLASVDGLGVQTTASCRTPSISRGGRFVTFDVNTPAWFGAVNLQVYVKDMTSGALDIASRSTAGAVANNVSYGGSISADGRFVAFQSAGSNMPTNSGTAPVGYSIYLRDRATGVTELASVSASGDGNNNYSYHADVSDDGRFVAFNSTASNLDIGASSSAYQVFVRDRALNTTRTVSLGVTNQPGNHSSEEPVLSGDGRFVVFRSTATDLAPNDTNLTSDVFLRDRGGLAPLSYCSATVNSQGCSPHVTTSGSASASAGSGFVITCSSVLNNKQGLLFYGTNGAAASPFLGGYFCVRPPTIRTPVQFSGGAPTGADCSGQFMLDFNAQIAAGLDPHLTLGAEVAAQFWSRDPATASTTNFSDAVVFPIGP